MRLLWLALTTAAGWPAPAAAQQPAATTQPSAAQAQQPAAPTQQPAATTQPPAATSPLRVVTWNLGWHLDQAQAGRWIQACSAPFALDPADRRWKPSATGRPGWELPWRRDAPIQWDVAQLPPCDVFRDFFRTVAVTPASYARRAQQIARVLQTIAPDVIAFQEVSGPLAVEQVLPDGGRDYEVCSYTGHSVQRLAFAWRRSRASQAEPCEVREALGLPQREAAQRSRPGLSVGLRVEGRLIRFLNVHLKSSCVSPLESTDPDGRGQLAGNHPACETLQAQLAPLESWLQDSSAGDTPVVMLGDFNRQLSHEARRPADEPVRLPAGQPRDPPRAGVRSTSLWREVNDGDPPASRLVLLEAQCRSSPGIGASPAIGSSPDISELCDLAATRPLDRDETRRLASREGLGCRNPIGLDHIAISPALRALSPAVKIPIGVFGSTRKATPERPDPLLAVSDHCPLTAVIALP